MMWQCQTNRPAMSKRAAIRVISPGSASTVSLKPVSQDSGGRGAPICVGACAPPNGRRSSTWNCTWCTWIGWPSSVKLRNSQISVAPRRGFSVTGATFDFKFAAGASGDTACFYFEVRRASTGAVVGTHGSSSSPVGCVTGLTQQAFSTAISELNTSDLANDNRIRVYARESAGKAITVDQGTVSGSTPATSFTLYPLSYTDASTGTPATTTWSLAASGGATYTSTSSWANAFSASRYLKVTFPSYIPTTATVSGGTFKFNYRPTSSGHNACYYIEVYSGATLIGTHGSTTTPISCNSTTTYTPDTVTLSEINTAARANGAIVKVYMWVSGTGTRTTDTDLAQLVVNYQ